jgi:hypothetical protein
MQRRIARQHKFLNILCVKPLRSNTVAVENHGIAIFKFELFALRSDCAGSKRKRAPASPSRPLFISIHLCHPVYSRFAEEEFVGIAA